ncbi:hypothetical protein EH31_00560 [Erythrobacter longus]|uniref:Uncharacterized protein n=1 Tax=Erythrobacter longus TaxID=1044 RepID=A0A074MCL2_ERYLO|nr:hypothetical protein [Erythrobacter longus]KEO91189.1 hypothetical protein EH31_00560 [Erythrobacter longus]
MSFEFTAGKIGCIDPTNGDVLKRRHEHYQSREYHYSIIGSDGVTKFTALVLQDADGQRANPSKKGDHVLVRALRHNIDGSTTDVTSSRDRDLSRLISYLKKVHSHNYTAKFTMSDKRFQYRPIEGPLFLRAKELIKKALRQAQGERSFEDD